MHSSPGLRLLLPPLYLPTACSFSTSPPGLLEHLLFPTLHLAPPVKVKYVSYIRSEALSSLGAGRAGVCQLCVPSNTSAPNLESCT